MASAFLIHDASIFFNFLPILFQKVEMGPDWNQTPECTHPQKRSNCNPESWSKSNKESACIIELTQNLDLSSHSVFWNPNLDQILQHEQVEETENQDSSLCT